MKDQSKIEAIIADQKRILVRNRQSLFQYARQAVEKDNPAAESMMADLLADNGGGTRSGFGLCEPYPRKGRRNTASVRNDDG